MSTSPAKIGHNSNIDFDLATDFVDVGPLSGRKDLDSKQLANFRHAIRTQGNNNIRQRSISNMLERARANAAVSHAEFRILDRIAQRCRGGFRYTIEPQDTLGFFCGIEHRQNVARVLPSLIDLGFVVSIDVPSRTGGRPRRFYTVVCTGGDRTGTSRSDLAFEARRRNLELMDDEAATKLADAIIAEMEAKKTSAATHQDDASDQEIERPMHHHDASIDAKHHHDALPKHHHDALRNSNKTNTLEEAKHHYDALNGPLHQQGAKHHHDDVSVYSISLEGDSPLSSESVERGVRGERNFDSDPTPSPSAPPPNEGSTTKVRSSAQRPKPETAELVLKPIDGEVVEAEVLNPGDGFGERGAKQRKQIGGAAPSERKKPRRPFPEDEDECRRLVAYCRQYGADNGMDDETFRLEIRQWHDRASRDDERYVNWEAAWRTWVANWRKWKRPSRSGQTRRSDADIINDL